MTAALRAFFPWPRKGVVLAALTALIMSAGCSLAPQYETPAMDIPKEWGAVDAGAAPPAGNWWERFGDPVLDAMVVEALSNNLDIEAAVAKLAQAQAQSGQAATALSPVATASGAARSSRSSLRAPNAAYGPGSPMKPSTVSYQGVLGGSWELDFWGKYRNLHTALSDVMLATSAGVEAARLLVAGRTAQGYFNLRGWDMQLETARNTLKTREGALKIYAARYKQGEIAELDWQRARSEVETARVLVHAATVSVDAAEASLAALLGRSPRDVMFRAVERGASIERLPAPLALPAGLPSDLLNRRPDIRSAEYMVMASNANIGAARAEFFPAVSLTGALGTLSSGVGWLFSGPAGTWNYGAQGSLPILDFGRTWYKVKDAEARKRQAVALYRKTVQSAFQDVRTALVRQREADAVAAGYKTQADSLRRAVELARLQYDNGYADYLAVLDAERQLFTAEMLWAASMSERLSAVVSVCMALGGGWEDSKRGE